MLQITQTAADAFRTILSREDVTGSAIRLAPTRENDGQIGITLQAVEQPGPDDAPTTAEGVEVTVAPELAPALDDAILDAKPAGEGTEFFIRAQA